MNFFVLIFYSLILLTSNAFGFREPLSSTKKSQKEFFLTKQKIDANQRYRDVIKKTQKIVLLSSPKSKNKILPFLQKNQLKIMAEGESFLVIRPHSQVSRRRYLVLIDKLKEFSSVIDVRSDSVVVPERDEFSQVNSCQVQPRPFANAVDGIRTVMEITEYADETDCHLSPHCQNNSNPSWAKMQIGADLADEVVQDVLSRNTNASKIDSAATVGIIDTGFDETNQRNGINSLSLKIERGHSSAGNPRIDPGGHGTTVSGMVSGKNVGVTKNVNLRLYRVTEENNNDSASQGFLAAAIEKACEESDIVNVSWGSKLDEIGLSEVEESLWYEKASDQGCLVIKSAGNSGVKSEKTTKVSIESPFLSVAASNQFSDEAAFSTKGMIQGPGEGVYSLLSYQHNYSNYTIENACKVGGTPVGPINGTSFAAPAVAGVAGQVLTILKSRNVVPEKPQKKIALVKSILFASSQWNALTGGSPGVVNALAASLIAKGITKTNVTNDVDDLIKIGRKSSKSKCSKNTERCIDKTHCDDKKACTNLLRFQTLVCLYENEEKQEQLFTMLQSLEERELSIDLISRLPQGSFVLDKAATVFKNSWYENIENGEVDDLTYAIYTMDSARKKGITSVINSNTFKQLIRSTQFSITFNVNALVGENIWNGRKESFYPKLLNIFRSLPQNEQIAIIRELPNIEGYYIEGEIGFLYLLAKEMSSLNEVVQKILSEKLDEQAKRWFEGKMDFANGTLGMSGNVPVFSLFLERLKEGERKLKEKVDQGLNKKNIHLYSYALSSETVLNDNEKKEISLKLLEENLGNKDIEISYLLDSATENLVEKSTPDSDNSVLKKFLITNPLIRFPRGAVTSLGFLAEPKHKVFADKNFIEKFVEANMSRALAMAKGQSELSFTSSIPLDNVVRILINNGMIDESFMKKILNSQQEHFKKILKHQSVQLVANKNEDWRSENHVKKVHAQETVEKYLKHFDLFKEYGLEGDIKVALNPLKRDILKNPGDYPQSLRGDIRRIFGLGES